MTLSDENVARMLEDFVTVIIDVSEDKTAREACKIQGIPWILIYSPEGEELVRKRGYQGPEEFMAWAKPFAMIVGPGEGS